ncbi:MAG: DUF975 family protein [Lachnospiraceae bacterium]|nr:DUF975 family protein [Lachnospiraceae bacterium]
MYKTGSQLKRQAREALSGKWGTAVLMALLISAVSVVFSYSTSENVSISFGSLIGTILSIFLTVGISSFMLKICCGQKDQATFADIIYGFQCHPGKALLLYLLSILYLVPGTLIYALLIFVLTLSVFAGGGMSLYTFLYTDAYIDPSTAGLFVIIFFLLTVAYAIYAAYISLTYSMVYYVLLDYPDLPVNEIWKRSRLLMKGNRMRLFGIELSFIGWMFLCIFTAGIGFLWLSPYMQATQAAFYLDLVQQHSLRYNAAGMSGQTVIGTGAGVNNTPNSAQNPYMGDAAQTPQADPGQTGQEAVPRDYSGIDTNTFK